MSQYTLNIIHQNQTKTIHLTSNQTVKIPAQAGARYQILNEKGVLIYEPKMQEMGNDLWLFLDNADDKIPEIVLTGYGDFSPITNSLNLMQMDATLALTNAPAAMPLMPTNVVTAVPETTAQLASEVSTSAAVSTSSTSTTQSTSSTALATSSSKILMGALGAVALAGVAAAASAGGSSGSGSGNSSNSGSSNGSSSGGNDAPAAPQPTLDKPKISNVKITSDNVINEAEATQTVAVSGSVSGARNGDKVKIYVGNQEIGSGEVSDNQFNVNVKGADLAAAVDNAVRVEVVATDVLGNTQISSTTQNYNIAKLTTPEITLQPITGDSILNAQEIQKNVTISGSLKNAVGTEKVEILLDGQVVATTSLINNNFNVEIAGSILDNASNKTITARAHINDAFGNSKVGEAQTHYIVQKTAKQPEITINSLTDNNIINEIESKSNIVISGSITHVNMGDKVEIVIDNQVVATTSVINGGTFWQYISGNVLAHASDKTVTVRVQTTDAAGNSTTGSASKTYEAHTEIAQPQIQINNITDDNIINGKEANGNITVSGSVSGARDGDKVEILLDNKVIGTTTVQANAFSSNLSGSLLSQSTDFNVQVRVTATDKWDNSTVGVANHAYEFVARVATPSVQLDNISYDNVINAQEAKNDITISGKTDIADGQKVELLLDNQVIATTIANNGRFLTTVAGNLLAHAQSPELVARVTNQDTAGNTASATDGQKYTVHTDLPNPSIQLTNLTSDNIINATESKENVTIQGTTSGTRDGDTVEILLDKKVIATTTLQGNDATFGVAVAGAVLANGNSKILTARATTTDEFGNSNTAETTHNYDVQLTPATQPVISLNFVTDDNIINVAESNQDIVISGKTQNVDSENIDILLDGKVIATTQAQNGEFSVNISGSLLANAATHALSARVQTIDNAGNVATGETKHTYDVDVVAPSPTLTIKPISDGVINAAEKDLPINVSGSIGGARTGDTIRLMLGNEEIGSLKIGDDKTTFNTQISGSVLSKNQGKQTLTAILIATDDAGNATEISATRQFNVDTEAPVNTVVQLNPITGDDILNTTDDIAGNITVSGSTDKARVGNVVTLKINNIDYTATVQADGTFRVDVPGSELAKTNQIEYSINAVDEAGNSVVVPFPAHTYTVVHLTEPQISNILIADDNRLNDKEKISEVTISGSVSGARDGDNVKITFGDKELTGTVTNGQFSLKAQGADLAAAVMPTVSVEVVATDDAGNRTSGKASSHYTINSLQPPLVSDVVVADDDALNSQEMASEVRVSGKVLGARTDDVVNLIVDNQIIATGKVVENAFVIEGVKGADLANATNKNVRVDVIATDDAGNEMTGSLNQTYRVVTLATPSISNIKISDDNKINMTEATQTVTVSGSVSGVRDGDKVKIYVGNKEIGSGEVSGSQFNVNVKGADLAAAANKSVRVEVMATDDAGNSAVGTKNQNYQLVKLNQPTAKITAIAGDDFVLSSAEATGQVVISGNISQARDGDKVRVLLDGVELATGEINKNTFNIEVDSTKLIQAQNKNINVEIMATDDAGNNMTVTADKTYALDSLAAPQISLAKIATDDVLNEKEAAEKVLISGSVSGAKTGDAVRVLLDGTEIGKGEVTADAFNVEVDGATLAAAKTPKLTVEITTKDNLNQQIIGTKSLDYTVATLATPVISKMTISEDNQINTTEATQEVAVSGSVSGARDKDVVKVYLGNKEIGSGEVSGSQFSINVNGADLAVAADKSVRVEVIATDKFGNEKSASQTQNYTTPTLPEPIITINSVAGDNKLTANETTQQVAVSGNVSGARDKDIVKVYVGDKEIGSGEVSGSQFTVNVNGADLKTNNQVRVEVIATDAAGNSATGSQIGKYEVVTLAAPIVTVTSVAGDDNTVNLAESQTQVPVTGSVSGARDKDVVKVYLGDKEIGKGEVAGNQFTVNVNGAELATATTKQIRVEVIATDEFGSQTPGSNTADYAVQTTVGQATLTLDAIAQDGIINRDEADSQIITVSGSVSGVPTGSEVTFQIDGNDYYKTTKVINGHFSLDMNTSDLLNANVKSLTATVHGKDNVGNPITASNSKTYEIINTANTVEVKLNPIATDDIINAAESQQDIEISGSVTVTKENTAIASTEKVNLVIGSYTQTVDVVNGTFTHKVPASVLLQANDLKVQATVISTDVAGNVDSSTTNRAYMVDLVAETPVISINNITHDNIISSSELGLANIPVVGSISNTQDGDKVTVTIGDKVYENILIKNHGFSLNVEPSVLTAAAANNKIVINVAASDKAGNTTTAHYEHTYQVITNIEKPVLNVNLPVFGDNIINKTESTTQQKITGTVENAQNGDLVEALIGTEVIGKTEVSQAKTFEITVDGAKLAQAADSTGAAKVEIRVTKRDALGNQSSNSQLIDYTVDIEAPKPEININPVTQDNIINRVESTAAQTTLSGSLKNVREGDDVVIYVGANKYFGTVKNSGFSVAVPTSVLVAQVPPQFSVTVTGRDDAGNSAELTAEHTYKIKTTLSQPTITVNPITEDNVLNLQESNQTYTKVSGTTTGARDDDEVILTVAGKTFTGKVVNNTYAIDVPNADLVTQTQLTAKVIATDTAGNQSTSNEVTHNYQVDIELKKPDITVDNITGDNIINLQESKMEAKDIEIKGHATNTRVGDTVILRIGDTSYPSTILANDGSFLFKVSGKELDRSPAQFTVTVNNSDDAQNTSTNTYTHTYQVVKDIAQPTISLNSITEDNMINKDESIDSVNITGTTTNAVGGKVTLTIGTTTHTTTVQEDGSFTFKNISGSLLAENATDTVNGKTGQVAVKLDVNHAGNTATVETTRDYQVITEIATPEITIGKIGDDDNINADEAKTGTMVNVTGTVANARDGDKVTVIVGWNNGTFEGKLVGNTYNIAVPGELLAQNSAYTVRVDTQDVAGNTASGESSAHYSVDNDTATPTIKLNTIPTLKINDLQGNVTFSGTVNYDTYDTSDSNVQVNVIANGKTHAATVSGTNWTVTVAGSELNAHWGNNDISIVANVTDNYGNKASGSLNTSYQAQLADVVFDKVTEDNIITRTEYEQQETTHVTGTVVGDFKAGDIVSISLYGKKYEQAVQADGKFGFDLPTKQLVDMGTRLKTLSDRTLTGTLIAHTANGETQTVNTELKYFVKISTNMEFQLDDLTGDKYLDANELKAQYIAVTGKLASRFDDNDLKMVHTITTTINGHTYTTKTNGITGDFTFQIATKDLIAEPVSQYSPAGQNMRAPYITLSTGQDTYGNPLTNIASALEYRFDETAAARLKSAYQAPQWETRTLDDTMAMDTLSATDGQTHHENADNVYRAASNTSQTDTQAHQYYVPDSNVQNSVYADSSATTTSTDEAATAYTYDIQPNANTVYAYHTTAESDYEVVDDVAANTKDAVSSSEPANSTATWETISQHDLTETTTQSTDDNPIHDDHRLDYEVVADSLPNMLTANPTSTATDTANSANQPADMYALDTTAKSISDELLSHAHQII